MSRYKCWKCKNEHGTDNVEAICVLCFTAATEELALAKSDLAMACRVAENHKDETARAVRIGCENITAREKAEAERDALKKAKTENDERFMTERDEARRERDELKEKMHDMVPRSRYNVCCDQYNEAEAARKNVTQHASDLAKKVVELEGRLAKAENAKVSQFEYQMKLEAELSEQAAENAVLSKSLKATCQEISEQAAVIVVMREALGEAETCSGDMCIERMCRCFGTKVKTLLASSPPPRVKALTELVEAAKIAMEPYEVVLVEYSYGHSGRSAVNKSTRIVVAEEFAVLIDALKAWGAQ